MCKRKEAMIKGIRKPNLYKYNGMWRCHYSAFGRNFYGKGYLPELAFRDMRANITRAGFFYVK